MGGDREFGSEQVQALLLSRVRSVAFAALRAGVEEAELQEALRVAAAAHQRELVATPPRQRHLRTVPAQPG